MRDFFLGFRKFHFSGPCFAIFGSARIKEDHPWYELTRRTARAVVDLGLTVMTGGVPGRMEAANRGAQEACGAIVGISVELPSEQKHNDYIYAVVTM